MHDAYIGGRFQQTKKPATQQKTCNYIELFGSSTRDNHAQRCIYWRTFRECMTISGGRTKQLDIFCHVTGFASDFLSFIVVELIRFFRRAIHWWRQEGHPAEIASVHQENPTLQMGMSEPLQWCSARRQRVCIIPLSFVYIRWCACR